MDIKTRRLKVLAVQPDLLVDLIARFRHHQQIAVPMYGELPMDTEVLSVSDDRFNRMIYFVIAHESFPEVPAGETLPIIYPMHFVRVVNTDLAEKISEQFGDEPIEVRSP